MQPLLSTTAAEYSRVERTQDARSEFERMEIFSLSLRATQETIMNGAEVILRTLANNGVEASFSNPGTSEMQLVAAFDHEPRVRPVLCLFEGVATGAAEHGIGP
jgi:hypothetical protein